jgi:hypothetical protein
MKLSLSRHYISLLLIICSVLIFGITLFAPVSYESSDPAFVLLTSQAIIEYNTVNLDAYENAIYPHYFEGNRRIFQRNGHYYHYSIGTGIFSVPFVWIANLIGKDMTIYEHGIATQNVISAILSALIFIIIYQICACYLDSLSSFVISTISVLGSTLISTIGGGLWNIVFAVFFELLALLHLSRYDSGKIKGINPYWLGFLLFSAFLSRPTAGFFIVAVFAYLLFKNRQLFLKVSVFSLMLLLFLATFVWFEYREMLPAYYSPRKVLSGSSASSFLVGFHGNLLSPSKGIFIFNPFLILVCGVTLRFFNNIKTNAMFWLSILWVFLHIMAISYKSIWWGGHAYGPRLLTDIIPALILVTVILWREVLLNSSLLWTKRMIATGFLTLGILGVFINSYQGLYNIYTQAWNEFPDSDVYTEYLFSWKYPQFLASKESLRRRNLEHYRNHLNVYPLGDTITYEGQEIAFNTDAYVGDNAIFHNWYLPETNWRWSKGTSSRIVFKPGAISRHKEYIMEIVSASLKSQEISVALNGTSIGYLELSPLTGTTPEIKTLTLSGILLDENNFNEIEFVALGPSIGDDWASRYEGFAFVSLKIYPQVDEQEGIYYFDSEFFEHSFSSAEENWRWPDGIPATITYSLDELHVDLEYVMGFLSGVLDVQTVDVVVNGTNIGNLTFAGPNPQTQVLTFRGHLLKANNTNQI